MNFNHEGHEGV